MLMLITWGGHLLSNFVWNEPLVCRTHALLSHIQRETKQTMLTPLSHKISSQGSVKVPSCAYV